VSEPTARDDARSCTCSAHVGSRYCDRCDLLLGLNGVHAIAVEVSGDAGLRVVVETPASPMGCRECGVLARARGRRDVALVDVPSAGRAVQLVWRKRTWRCLEPACPTGSFSEVEKSIAQPRALLSTRAAWWAIGQLRREHACIEVPRPTARHDLEDRVAGSRTAAGLDGPARTGPRPACSTSSRAAQGAPTGTG
jgi:transposase